MKIVKNKPDLLFELLKSNNSTIEAEEKHLPSEIKTSATSS